MPTFKSELNRRRQAADAMTIQAAIRTVRDFPKPGIMFRDVTPILTDSHAFKTVIDIFAEQYADLNIDAIAGIEARGFIFGAALAARLNCGFIPLRKPGKIPGETIRVKYDLEYGSNELHISKDVEVKGKRIVIVDDLMATGGTAEAACNLILLAGGYPYEVAVVVNVPSLGGHLRMRKSPLSTSFFSICE